MLGATTVVITVEAIMLYSVLLRTSLVILISDVLFSTHDGVLGCRMLIVRYMCVVGLLAHILCTR